MDNDLFFWDDRVESCLLTRISWEPRWCWSLQTIIIIIIINLIVIMIIKEPGGTQAGFEGSQAVAIPSSAGTQGNQVVPEIIINDNDHPDDDQAGGDEVDCNDDLSQRWVSLRYGGYPTFQ